MFSRSPLLESSLHFPSFLSFYKYSHRTRWWAGAPCPHGGIAFFTCTAWRPGKCFLSTLLSSSWKASPCPCILINLRLVFWDYLFLFLNQACGMLKRVFAHRFETKCGNIGGAIPHQQHQLHSIACAIHPTVLRPFLCEILQLLDEEKSAEFPDLEWVLHGTHAVCRPYFCVL